MKAFALFLGFALAALCAVALVTPELLLGVARHFATPAGLYVAAALRIGLGILFLGIAGRSRSPTGLRILGAITLIGGVLTPFVGVDRAQAYLDWWSHRGDLVLRHSRPRGQSARGASFE